jgi:rod shape determining protein RodA
MSNQAKITKGIDWKTGGLYIILVSIGLLCIYSVEQRGSESFFESLSALKKNYARQIIFMGMAGVVAILILLTDSKFFTATANISYAIGILLMLLTLEFACLLKIPCPKNLLSQ